MTEPISTAATGTAISVGTVTLVGTVFGMRYDLLLLGLFGVLCSLAVQEKKKRTTAFSLVAISTLFSGAISPVAGAVLAKWLDLPGNVEDLRICAAPVIGFGWQAIAPAVWGLMTQRYGAKEMS